MIRVCGTRAIDETGSYDGCGRGEKSLGTRNYEIKLLNTNISRLKEKKKKYLDPITHFVVLCNKYKIYEYITRISTRKYIHI